MNELEVKKVPFMGTELMAARDNDGQIWAGVSYICRGIGLSKNEKDRQVKNVQSDRVLMKGCGKFDAGVFDPNNSALALKLDYVPLWLAKIAITPKMERETPELAAKLEQYQLKAKDVLAAAFLPQNKQTASQTSSLTPSPVEQRALTTDDYITAARLSSDCRNERLPYVLGFLARGGFDIPQVEAMATPKQTAYVEEVTRNRTILNLDDYL